MNQKVLIAISAIAALIIGALLVFNYFQEETTDPVAKPESETIENAVLAGNRFALDLYAETKDRETNIFFSPYSLSVALAMTYEGAREETAREMENVFYFPEDSQIRRKAYSELQTWLLRKNSEYEINIANAIWPQKDFSFLEEYFDIISEYYHGLIESVDFVAKPEQSREKINKWVQAQTRGRIKDLIPQGAINPLTRLILTNAIYFKGEWLQAFNKINTRTASFYIAPKDPVKVEMMQRLDEEAEFPYYATEDFQVLEMPYSGQEASMLVLLPKEGYLGK